jgi:hypothetical protein
MLSSFCYNNQSDFFTISKTNIIKKGDIYYVSQLKRLTSFPSALYGEKCSESNCASLFPVVSVVMFVCLVSVEAAGSKLVVKELGRAGNDCFYLLFTMH